MSKTVKYSVEKLGWQKKPGPPKVWRVVEGRKKTADGKTLKFSIQEVPEDRHDDVMHHMRTNYLRDEAMCRYLGMLDCPDAVNDFCNQWHFALQQGVVTGAFLVEENNPKPVLAGVAMTVISTPASEKCMEIIGMKSEKCQKMINHFINVEREKDTRELYNVDDYVMGFGLSVDPQYRGQGLAYQLIRAREDIGNAYDVRATSSTFTAPECVKAATEAGWEILIERDFNDTKNEDGTLRFPGISIKSCTFMGKNFATQK